MYCNVSYDFFLSPGSPLHVIAAAAPGCPEAHLGMDGCIGSLKVNKLNLFSPLFRKRVWEIPSGRLLEFSAQALRFDCGAERGRKGEGQCVFPRRRRGGKLPLLSTLTPLPYRRREGEGGCDWSLLCRQAHTLRLKSFCDAVS